MGGIQLINADQGANFANADLSESRFAADAWLDALPIRPCAPDIEHRVQLAEASLVEANLTGAHLPAVNLDNVDMSGAQIRDAQLSGACLASVVLNLTDLSNSDDGRRYEASPNGQCGA